MVRRKPRRRGTGIAPPNSPRVIPVGIPTLPAMLQEAGYRTAVVGKWHLGLGEQPAGPDWNGRPAPGETTDVRDQFPDVAARLSKNLDAVIQK